MTVGLINPANQRPLRRAGDALVDGDRGAFPIIDDIPRFCEPSNYTDSFGKQWKLFRLTQIDTGVDGQDQSSRRFFAETGWSPEELAGLEVLEVGSGAGRFTRVMLERTTAILHSIDYSTAVEANFETNREIADGRLHLAQASIYDLPFADGSFDKVFCLGVLQHTPSFEGSVRALISKAKKGGEIVVDFYPIKGWWTKVSAKYVLRPITRRMSHERLLGLVESHADWLMRAHKGLSRMGLRAFTRFLPIVDLSTLPRGLLPEREREWAVLDTFDMFSPEYDNPQRVEAVADMFRRNGAEVIFAGFVDTGDAQTAVVRAVRR